MSIRFHCVAFFHVLTHPAEGITPSYFWSLDDWALRTPGYHHPWTWWCHFVMSHDATARTVVCNSMPCSRIMCFLVIKGRVRHLFLSSGELKQYLIQTERVLQRYAQRMQWLLSGEHHHTELQHEIIYSALCKDLLPPQSPLNFSILCTVTTWSWNGRDWDKGWTMWQKYHIMILEGISMIWDTYHDISVCSQTASSIVLKKLLLFIIINVFY